MKNFGMDGRKQYMASKGRPRHAHGFLAAHINCTVMLSVSETSLDIAPFAESKMI
jgi:hypothetical protein